MSDLYHITDWNGLRTVIDSSELHKILIEKECKIFDMDMDTIAALRAEYVSRNGPMPMTPESVKEVFGNG